MPPESIPPARDSSFAWFAGRALSELHDGVSLAQWLAAHRNDTLPRENGPWCAQAVATTDIEEDRIAIRRAYFYQPIPPADSKRVPGERPDIARECVLARIGVEMEAGRSEDSLIAGAQLELRRLFGSGRRPDYAYDAYRIQRLGEAPTDTIVASGKLPLSDSPDRLNEEAALPAHVAADSVLLAPLNALAATCLEAINDSIIDTGTRLLLSAESPSAQMVLHYRVGDAYAEKTAENPGVRAFRDATIDHYRAALGLEPTPPSSYSRRVRWNLWRLQAGLLPALSRDGLDRCIE